ncbi:MAG: 4Fe-4S dicluster domain-containing protein [Lentisphaerae bacterium]|nr:4Fe-4S dicluster domain-containing protein [Lentisphaerota bacterium]
MSDEPYDYLAGLPLLPRVMGEKKKTPRSIAVVIESSCTGCRVCVPFCPVDCIETVPEGEYTDTVIPPVRIRYNECIGCAVCVRACEKLTWNAIEMVEVDVFEAEHGVKVEGPRYGWEGIKDDASQGTPAAEMLAKLQAEGKIKIE